jgi:hypothetical protein
VLTKETSVSNKVIPALAALLLLGTAAAWYWWPRIAPTPPVPPVTAPPPDSEPAVAHPLPPAGQGGEANLPDLATSDTVFGAALLAVPGAAALRDLLRPETLIRRIVATADNLPRHRLAVDIRPLRATAGTFLVQGDDTQASIGAANAARYAPYLAVVRSIDVHALSDLYRRYYPLFQRAYQDLGYPTGDFNDRLVSVIDHLLATPQPAGPLALVRPKVFWEFADPELEARSAGQKLLLRLGADNGARVRARLGEFRALIVAGTPGGPGDPGKPGEPGSPAPARAP